MRAIAMLVLLALLLAACSSDEGRPADGGSATPAPSPATIPYSQAPPEPAGRVPQGVLLVQQRSDAPAPVFGIAANGQVRQYGRGYVYGMAPGGRSALLIEQEQGTTVTGLGVIRGDKWQTVHDGIWTTTNGDTFPSPLYSPDGSRLAYVAPDGEQRDKNQVYMVNADGGDKRQLTAEADYYWPLGWTADGRLIVRATASLLLLGEGEERLALPVSSDYGDISVSPDGRRLALLTQDYDGDEANSVEGSSLWVAEIGGDWRLVATSGSSAARRLDALYVSAVPPARAPDPAPLLLKGPPPMEWSPDSTRIAYYHSYTDADSTFHSELHVADLTTGADTMVAGESSWQAVWSPDGRYLAYVVAGKGLQLRADDGAVRAPGLYALGLTWTGDGRLLVSEPGGMSLYDPATGVSTEVSAPEGENLGGVYLAGHDAVWSPSGRYLAFTTAGDTSRGKLFILDTQTAQATVLVDKGSSWPVGWLAQ